MEPMYNLEGFMMMIKLGFQENFQLEIFNQINFHSDFRNSILHTKLTLP
jgi:ABC-type Fe3+ transport system permease subunit